MAERFRVGRVFIAGGKKLIMLMYIRKITESVISRRRTRSLTIGRSGIEH